MWNSFALRVLPADVPVDPSAPEAQQWAQEELARNVYNPQPSIFSRIGHWFFDILEKLATGTVVGSNPVAALVIALVVIALVVFVALNAARVRRVRNVAAQRHLSHTLFDDARSAADLRKDAEAAARAGDLNAAFLDTYRAIIRSLDERVLIEDRPGLTAREAAQKATLPFPAHRTTWFWAASVFDAVRYGETSVGIADVEQLRAFDREIGSTRPRLAEVGA